MDNLLFSVFPTENFIDLGLYQFGWEHCRPSHSFGPAVRNHYVFHYVISGAGTLVAEDKKGTTHTYCLEKGQGFMLLPGQITTYTADKEFPWEYTWLEFDGLRAKEAVEAAGLHLGYPVYDAGCEELRDSMVNEMLYIVQHAEQTPFHLIGHLYLFLDCLTRSSVSAKPRKSGRIRDFYIKESLSYIEQNFQSQISVEDMAEACGLNRSYFGKIFRDTVGCPPQEFLMKYRMTKAAELLKQTTLSINDIGNAVGYPNQLHFSRAFKNIYGVSPREWRRQNKTITTK